MSFTSDKRVSNQKPCKADADMDVLIANAEDLITRVGTLSLCRIQGFQSVVTSTLTKITLTNPASIDTGTYFNNASPTRLTIPSGITLAQIHVLYSFGAAAGIPGAELKILKNNAAVNGTAYVGWDDLTTGNMTSAILAVSAADYFEVSGYHTLGVNADIRIEVILRGWK